MSSLLFLGTGSSSGVPMIGCQCPVCTSSDPKNKRLRPSALVTVGGKRLLIDVGPDYRAQALLYGIDHLDGVLLTHYHYDHVAGLDELRSYYLLHRESLPVLTSLSTLDDLKRRYDYLFRNRSHGVSLSAQLHFQVLEGERGETDFLDIPIRYVTYEQGGTAVNGFCFGNLAYLSDVRTYSPDLFDDLQQIDTLIVNALKPEPSLMHFSIDEAIDFSKKTSAKQTYITHIGHEMEHGAISKQLPPHVHLAYDGLKLDLKQ